MSDTTTLVITLILSGILAFPLVAVYVMCCINLIRSLANLSKEGKTND